MIDEVLKLTPEEQAFKERILELERESISDLSKVDDKMTINTIIRMYEEAQKK